MKKINEWILKIYGVLLVLIAFFGFIFIFMEMLKDGNIYSLFFIAGMGGWFSLFLAPFTLLGPDIFNLILGYSFWRLRKWSIVLGSISFIYQISYVFLDYVSFKENIFKFEGGLIPILYFFAGIIIPLIILVLAISQRKNLTGKYFPIFPLIIGIIIIFSNLISSGSVDIPMNAGDIKYNSVEKELSNYSKSEKVLPYKLEESNCAGFAVNFVGEDDVEDRIKAYKPFFNNGPEYVYTHCYINKGEFVFVTKSESGFDNYMNTTTVYIIKNNKPQKITDFHTKDFKIFEDGDNFYFAHRSLNNSLIWRVYIFDEGVNNFLILDKFERDVSKICRVDKCYFIELSKPENLKEADNLLYKDIDFKNGVHLIKQQTEYQGFRLLQFTKDSMSFKVYKNLINGTYKEGDMIPNVEIVLPFSNSLNHINRLLLLNKETIKDTDVYTVMVNSTDGGDRYKLFVNGKIYNVLLYKSISISEEESQNIVENVIKNGEYKP